MTITNARRTFGTKNLKAPQAAVAQSGRGPTKTRKGAAVEINPLLLAAGGGVIFVLAAIFMFAGSPPAPPAGGPIITEVPAQPQQAAQPQQPAGGGGKFGAANSALSGANR